MNTDVTFTISSIAFDETYQPAEHTRITTNFANLARGARREENLRNTLKMINNRFNALAYWDNPYGDRYTIKLDIVSVEVDIVGNGDTFPSIEMLKTSIHDKISGREIEGVIGNNFSSYVRDYDFSIVLSRYNQDKSVFRVPEDFGELHGKLFRSFVQSHSYHEHFGKLPVICLSVSDNKTYHRSDNTHPVLGVEYQPDESSLTEQYFNKMGLKVRYFMPPHSVAPLAFYHFGDLLNDYTNLELASTISTMETFQKIYRPEIYNANTAAGHCYRPNLKHRDHSLTQIVYDREERTQLALKQGQFVEQHFIKPYQNQLVQWSRNCSL